MEKLFDLAYWLPLLIYGGLLFGDFLLGVITACLHDEFDWKKLGDWARKFGATGAGLVILAILSAARSEVQAAFWPAVATASASVAAQIAEKIRGIIPQ